MVLPYTAVVGRNLLRFVYMGDMEEGVLDQEAVVFLDIGGKYNMEELKNFADNAMEKLLNEENMVNYFMAGDLYGAGRIRARAKDLIRMNLKDLMKKADWKEEFGGNTGLVTELMKSYISREKTI